MSGPGSRIPSATRLKRRRVALTQEGLLPPRLVARRPASPPGISKAGVRECVLSRKPIFDLRGSAGRGRAVSSAGSRGPCVAPGWCRAHSRRRKRRQQCTCWKRGRSDGSKVDPFDSPCPGRKQMRSHRTLAGASVRCGSELTVDSRGVLAHLGFSSSGLRAVRQWNWRQRTGNTGRCRHWRRAVCQCRFILKE